MNELPLWNKLPPALRQISDPSYELTKTSPLAISSQLFHSKLKTLLFNKSNLYSSSSSASVASSKLIYIYHSRMTIFLPDSLDRNPLPINFVFVKRQRIRWFPRLCFCGRCRKEFWVYDNDYDKSDISINSRLYKSINQSIRLLSRREKS